MSHLSASYSATLRVRLADAPGTFAGVAKAVGDAGGSLGAIDLVRIEKGVKIRDVTVEASSADHLAEIVEAVRAVEGVEVERTSDRTFLLHLGGKLEVVPKTPLKTRDDLSMAYTPGVARICMAVHDDPDSAWNLTIKKNTVAVISDGTAVLGLGDIGPEAAMPVMEGKAVLFKEFGGVDAFPLCLATKDVDEIVAICTAVAPTFGGINLEDISAPRCFEIERRLRETLDIPVFHDDQHGTAIVTLAAVVNALKVVGKRIEDVEDRDDGRRRGGDRHGGHPHARRRDERDRGRPHRRGLPRATGPHGVQGGLRRALQPREPPGHRRRAARRRGRVHRPLGAGRRLGSRREDDGERRDRVRDGEPDARGDARGDPGLRRGRRNRDAPTTPTRSTTCWRSPECSAAPSTCGPPRSPRG